MSYESIILDEQRFGGLPLAYWPLDEANGAVANDLMARARGSGYNGAISGNITLDQRPGPINRGKGWMFLGNSNGIINIGSDIIGSGNVTIEVWANPLSLGTSGQGRIIECGTAATRFLVGAYAGYAYAFKWYYASGASATSAPLASFGVPHHVVATSVASAGTVNFHVDGEPSGTPDQTIGAATGSYMAVGNRNDLVRPFHGYLGHLAIYPYILSPERIKAHYFAGINGTSDKKRLLMRRQ